MNSIVFFSKNFVVVLSLTLIIGCQSTRTVTPPADTNLSDLNHWQIKARVAIKTPEDNVTATLDWVKTGHEFDFHIYGTFGITYAHLIQEQQQAVLKLPDDQVFYHQDAQQLLYQSLGWDFPIDALSYWIKGIPSNKSGELINRNQSGDLGEAYLNDWKVEFSRYQNYSGFRMPRIIKAIHPQMTLKVVVKDWDFLPSE